MLEGEDLSEEIDELDRRGRRADGRRVRRPPSTGGLGSRRSSARRCSSSTAPRSPPDELREDVTELDRQALVEEFIEDARDAYDARRRSELGAGADARGRALRGPPGRRHPLARAPREHGLPARGHPPARDGAEGPARRVHGRGPRDVRGAGRADPRGGRLAPLPRRARRPRTPRQLQQPQEASTIDGGGSRTSTSRSPAPRRSPPRATAAVGASATAVAAGAVARTRASRSRRSSASSPSTTRSAATTRAGAARGKKYKKCHGA